MTIDVVKGTAVLVKIGDGAQPEVFSHPCMINTTRSVSFEAATSSDTVENCPDPDALATTFNFKASKSLSIDGAGKLDAAGVDFWLDALESPNPVNCKVTIGSQVVTVPMMVTKFTVNGEPRKYAEVSVSLVNHGDWTRAPA